MRHAQVINTEIDKVLAFRGDDVIDDTTQIPITLSTIQVDIDLWNIKNDSHESVADVTMTYHSEVDYWTVDVSDILSILEDRCKFVGLVTENGSSANMRKFKISEFAVDDETLEAWMRLPYEIKIDGGVAEFIWYEEGEIGNPAKIKYRAPAYEGGVGTTYATDPSRVTHRGDIVPYYYP